MRAYHFLQDDMKSNFGNEKAWKVGETREIKGELEMCRRGYHASPSWYDALGYAHGNMACIVEIGGYETGDGKYVAHKRTLIEARNAEKVLRTWGCDCAERAGKATKEKLAAARAAACCVGCDGCCEGCCEGCCVGCDGCCEGC